MQIFKPSSDKSYQGIYYRDGIYISYNLVHYYDCDLWKRGTWYVIHNLFSLKKKSSEKDNLGG